MMNKQQQGRKNRKSGAEFERKVRADLESEGWIVSKWSNNVEDGKLINAKHKFNPFSHVMTLGTGFPDFVAFKLNEKIIGVECKTNGRLDKTEKEKCIWLLNNKIFNDIMIASKEEKKINYKLFE